MHTLLLPVSILLGLLTLSACDPGPVDTGKLDTASDPDAIDADSDGYLASAGDCDDADAAVHPLADELCNDLDDDCDGAVDETGTDAAAWYGDGDADGYGAETIAVTACDAPDGFVAAAGDCDDGDASFHPGAEETCTDAVDFNCDGSVGYADADADGTPACEDCDDADATAFPGAEEVCDGADDDCDGSADEDAVDAPTWYTDADTDGYGDDATAVTTCEAPAGTVATAGDCDDAQATFHPGAGESCNDPTDFNCDGSVGYADADADGTPACEDCDDADMTAFPGAEEVCDGDDEDCDGSVDEAGATGERTWYADADADGFGDPGASLAACDAPAGYVTDATDCADADATAFPAAAETCDGVDDDCDGTVDDDATDIGTWYADGDGDGYGDPSVSAVVCVAPANHVADGTDCDDGARAINPGADEVCDAADVDEDCDGDSDDSDASVDGSTETEWYIDYDADGYGTDGRFSLTACDTPAGYAADADDCDDFDAAVNPGELEACDEADVDEDCDGRVDQDDAGAIGASTYYLDADADGYGIPDTTTAACALPAGYAAVDTDCDDSASHVNPGTGEVCDAADTDEDCDGIAEDFDGSATGQVSFYADTDADGYGAAAVAYSSCDAFPGWVADDTDCDDFSATDHPGATETVGNLDDEDCDGAELCYDDADNDGYLSASSGMRASADLDCADAYEGLASDPTTDCNDASALTRPGASETCDLADNDCDGTVDEGVGSTFYADVDGDGHGVTTSTAIACTAPSGYVAAGDDCDDADAALNPEAADVCGDTIDQDCDADLGDCNLDGSYANTTADVQLTGVVSSDTLGRSVAIGDFDGDGQSDVLGGMSGYDTPASGSGASVLWYGPMDTSGTFTATMDAMITGPASSASMGWSVAAGDLDGDGADDLISSAYATSSSAGAVYVKYGGATRLSGAIAATAADATFTGGASSDYLGYHLSAGGDLDGDGMDELVMGAYGQDGAASSAGAAYLVYGSTTRLSGSAAASTTAATIRGVVASDYLGWATAFVDDMDGDGLDELLVGSYGANGAGTDYGAAYLFLGDATRMSGTLAASTADRTWSGVAGSDYAGYGVNNLGDLDGDGYAEAGVHGYGYDSGSSLTVGALWIYSGALGSIPTTATATVYGLAAYDQLGEEAMSLGDLDGDGAGDLLVGAHYNDTAYTSAGAAYLFYGPITGSVSASTADATFLGRSGGDGHFGRRLPDFAGDVTGDGVNDVVVGAYWDDSAVYDGGSIYIWEGLIGD